MPTPAAVLAASNERWNLTTIFPSLNSAEYERHVHRFESDIEAFSARVGTLEARVGVSPELAESKRLVDDGLQELRHVTQGLRPPALDDLGLGPAIEALAREAGQVGEAGLVVRTEITALPRLGVEVEHACYRLAQEALTNISRHAQAKNVQLSLRQEGGTLVLEVEDDGRGFSPGSELGLGLVGARERAAAVSGSLTVDSKPGGGTRLRVVLPLMARTISSAGRSWAEAEEKAGDG